GQFGQLWAQCEDAQTRQSWDTQAMLGRQKIFEVRRHHNDVTFIDEFLTQDFAKRHKLFNYAYNKKNNSWEIAGREFKEIKNKLLFELTNGGQPNICVVDGNYHNRGELLLQHSHDGLDLRQDYLRDTLAHLRAVWSRPVGLLTRLDGRSICARYDGQGYSEEACDAA
ncbi:MAG: SpoVR family protein, partial [Deltaproteobacteria bacterium]